MRSRNKVGIKQYIVKLKGYEETFGSWVYASDIKKMNLLFLCNTAVRQFRLFSVKHITRL